MYGYTKVDTRYEIKEGLHQNITYYMELHNATPFCYSCDCIPSKDVDIL